VLYTEPVREDVAFLPSPEALKRKVIVKAKKRAAAERADESESEEEQEAERIAVDMKADIKQVRALRLLMRQLWRFPFCGMLGCEAVLSGPLFQTGWRHIPEAPLICFLKWMD
jgi:hypothetical protein